MGEVKLKNSTTATLLTVGAAFPLGLPLFQGYGQIYNGQYLKVAGFFVNAVVGISSWDRKRWILIRWQ